MFKKMTGKTDKVEPTYKKKDRSIFKKAQFWKSQEFHNKEERIAQLKNQAREIYEWKGEDVGKLDPVTYRDNDLLDQSRRLGGVGKQLAQMLTSPDKEIRDYAKQVYEQDGGLIQKSHEWLVNEEFAGLIKDYGTLDPTQKRQLALTLGGMSQDHNVNSMSHETRQMFTDFLTGSDQERSQMAQIANARVQSRTLGQGGTGIDTPSPIGAGNTILPLLGIGGKVGTYAQRVFNEPKYPGSGGTYINDSHDMHHRGLLGEQFEAFFVNPSPKKKEGVIEKLKQEVLDPGMPQKYKDQLNDFLDGTGGMDLYKQDRDDWLKTPEGKFYRQAEILGDAMYVRSLNIVGHKYEGGEIDYQLEDILKMDDKDMDPSLKAMAKDSLKYYGFAKHLRDQNEFQKLLSQEEYDELEVDDEDRKLIVKKDGNIVERVPDPKNLGKTIDKPVFNTSESADGRLFGTMIAGLGSVRFGDPRYLTGFKEGMESGGKVWDTTKDKDGKDEWDRESERMVTQSMDKAGNGLVPLGRENNEFVSTYFPKVIDKQVELTDKPGQFRGMFDKMSKKLPGLKKHLDQMPNLKATPSPTKDKTTPVMEI